MLHSITTHGTYEIHLDFRVAKDLLVVGKTMADAAMACLFFFLHPTKPRTHERQTISNAKICHIALIRCFVSFYFFLRSQSRMRRQSEQKKGEMVWLAWSGGDQNTNLPDGEREFLVLTANWSEIKRSRNDMGPAIVAYAYIYRYIYSSAAAELLLKVYAQMCSAKFFFFSFSFSLFFQAK